MLTNLTGFVLDRRRYGVTGYPTLKFFPAGSSEPEAYEGARELEALVSFVNSKAGTLRRADGSLLPTAGRVEALDALISSADFHVTDKLVEALRQAVTEGGAGAVGQEYVNAAQKVLSKGGAEYVTKELARLDAIIGGGSVVPDKRSAFQLRRNVLAAFQNNA
jgi:protein disulfide-isomerase A6